MLLTRLQLIIAGMAIALLLVITVVQTLRIDGFRLGPIGFDGMADKLKDVRTELALCEGEKSRQRQVTKDNIARADEGKRLAERVAERIEAAPLPGNCQTPTAILEADL